MKSRSLELPAMIESLERATHRERSSRLRALPDREAALLALAEEAERLAGVDPKRALGVAGLTVELADEMGSGLARARARRAHARSAANAGRFVEALSNWAKAADLARIADEDVEAAMSVLASMQALAELGRFDEALRAGHAAREIFIAAEEPELAARADTNLGIVYQRRDEPSLALVHFDRARPVLSSEPVAAGQVDSNRGEALLALNEFKSAEQAFLSALRSLHQTPWAAAVVEGNLADLAVRQGRLERAMHYFERARRHFESNGSTSHCARLIAEQADAMALLGLVDDAHELYLQAIRELDQQGLTLEAARARAGMGSVLMRLGRYSDAQTWLAAAAKSFDEIGHGAARARVDIHRGELAMLLGRDDDAHALLTNALVPLQNRPADSAAARFHLARIALRDGDTSGAEAMLESALASARRLDIAPLLADLLHLDGLRRREQSDNDSVVQLMEDAVFQLERVRGTLQADRFRAAFLTNRVRVYQDLVSTLLECSFSDRVARAFYATEQAKSRSLLDLARGAVDIAEANCADETDPAQQRLNDEAARVRGEINALYSRFDQSSDRDAVAETNDQWRLALHERERTLQGLETRLASTRGFDGLHAKPRELREVQATIPSGTALIEYFQAGDELIAFVVTPETTRVFRRLASAAVLAEYVRRFRFQINRALRPGALAPGRLGHLLADVNREAQGLFELTMARLWNSIRDVSRLIIVPHGPLHLVPFSALFNDGAYLIESHQIQTIPSASLLHAAEHASRSAQERTGLVIGVADERAPSIEVEARQLASALPGAMLLEGSEATVARTLQAAPAASMVHIACHGRFLPTAPLASGLKLADGWLTVRDIYSMRLEAELVVLSGCETGTNVVTAGDELLGLVRGFLAAGAQTMVVSLWRTRDETTASLMTTFHDRWARARTSGGSVSGALNEAQRSMIETVRHPALWAPFVTVGRN